MPAFVHRVVAAIAGVAAMLAILAAGPAGARCANAKLVDIDPARFGAPDERKRLLARRQREIGDAPR